MQKLAIVVVLVALVAVHAVQNDFETRKQFVNFMKKYNKVYTTSEEFTLRYTNFMASLERSSLKNSRSKGAVYGITKFSDMSPEEFQNTILMKNPIVVSNNSLPHEPNMVLPKRVNAVPSTFDWRDKGAVTPVKDQEQCGSCWAFSVTENIESMWILGGHGTNSSVDLAPQQIVDCDWTDLGCNGGNTPTAYEYVVSAGGIESESSYPYQGEDGTCAFKQSLVSAKISSYKYATEWYSETDVQTSLVGWGPLSVCVDASNWQDYQSGVMTWEECAYVNLLDHCVQLVGYNAQASTPYWIVRNSWNTDWGVDGYIYLQMWEDTCGIAHEATCAVL